MNKNNSINSLEKVMLGGLEQWILIKGNSIENPLILFLHGGPGFTSIPFAHAFPDEIDNYFTIVHWDQRGAGKSFSSNISETDITIEQFISDTHELTGLLKNRFSKDKIILMGHSWGGVLGLLSAVGFPEDYYAYIGIGQVVNTLEADTLAYKYALCKAKEKYDLKAMENLNKVGYPPYTIEDTYMKNGYVVAFGGGLFNESSFEKLGRLAGKSIYYTEQELQGMGKGVDFSFGCLFDEISKIDYFKDVKNVSIPLYFLSGKHDFLVPHKLTKEYFDMVSAPTKQFIYFEKSGHFPYIEEPHEFQRFLLSVSRELLNIDNTLSTLHST